MKKVAGERKKARLKKESLVKKVAGVIKLFTPHVLCFGTPRPLFWPCF